MELIIQAGLYVGPVVFMVLFFMSARKNTNNIFLGLSLLCIWGALFINELHNSKRILDYPHLTRTGNIFAYLIYPFLYLYIRNTFYPGKIWQKFDYLLLLPALFYLVDMFPFFFLKSAAEKKAIAAENLSDLPKMFQVSEGWISIKGFHVLARYLFSIVLLSLCGMMIYRNRNNTQLHLEEKFNKPLLFMITLMVLYIPLLMPGIIGAIYHLSWFNLHFLSISLSLTLISVLLFLIFSPDVLYGYVNRRSNADIIQAKSTSVPDAPSTSDHRSLSVPIDEIIQKLESYVKNSKPFLQTGYTIHDLSKEIEIPLYQLSYAINHAYDMHFSNWLNHQRIEYFLQTAGDKHHMTLEAMAKEAGFSNRITFINAFKKEKGMAPGLYMKMQAEKSV